MFEFSSAAGSLPVKHIAAYAAAAVLGCSLGGYAIHEHHSAQNLAAKNDQTTAQLTETRHELVDLTSKVNMLVAKSETQPALEAAPAAAQPATKIRPSAAHRREDPRYKKLQSQLDAQGKAIEETRNAIASTQGDLVNTRTELTGSIARTHDELVVLQRRGERNYFEFDLQKSKEYTRKGPVSLCLRKANTKRQYADLQLIVDDRTLQQKHVNLYQPVMFYTPDTPQPLEIVINEVSKDHIHGYISAPKYRQSELATMAAASTNPDAAPVANQATAQPPARKRLTLPDSDPNQQQ